MHQNELISTLSESIIERSDLLRLSDLIESKSDKADILFKALQPSENTENAKQKGIFKMRKTPYNE